ncbi:MAG: LysR substrate-binding domain-containing protein [Pseudomonadota bacterium]
MNLRDLQYLVAVADHQHFSKAAQACHVSQPTLSMQLKKLEDYLGVQLLERSNKKVMVTPIGKIVVERARRMMQEAHAIEQVAKAAQDPYSGDFRLGAFPTLAPYFLPRIAPLIRKKLPKLKLLLIEEKTAQLLERLQAGTLDAALVALPVESDTLTTAPLFDDPFLLAVPLGHALAKRRTIRQHDIEDEPLLLLEDGHCLRNQALAVCSLIGASEHQDFRATSLETLRQMVASGVGITLIPELAMKKNDGIAYIPFSSPTVSRTIGLAWRKTSARQPCIDRLAGLMTGLSAE